MPERPDNHLSPTISDSGSGDHRVQSQAAPQIEGYEISGPLGEGGMGVVWRAVQLSTGRKVALKLLGAAVFGSTKARARFEREVELTARLEHPNIARVYDSGLRQGVHCYAMELIEGVPLDKYVEDHQLTQRQILELMRTACEAVQHAHQRGVIHRDLKPSNILVTSDGQPHVLDFGLAKTFLEDDAHLTISVEGQVAGTPVFMSPEQAAGCQSQLDTRTDVYSLGVILFRLLTGQFPHDPTGAWHEVTRRICEQEVKRPREITKAVDRELEALLLKALARNVDQRYASAAELAKDLENYLDKRPLAAKPATAGYFLGRYVRKYRVPVGITAAVALVFGAAAVLAYARIAKEKAIAEENRKKAELQVADNLVSQGDAFSSGDRWAEAKASYEGAVDAFSKLGMSTIRPDLGLCNILMKSPPEINSFARHQGRVLNVATSPDGRLALSGSSDNTIRLWEVATGRELRTFTGHTKAVSSVAFSPDGRLALSGSEDNTMRSWDVATGRELHSFTGHTNGVASVVFSPDGRLALSGGGDKTVRLWDVPTARELKVFTGHRSAVTSVVFSPDGRLALSGGDDGTVRLWEVGTGQELRAFTGQQNRVSSVAFSMDGQLALSGNADNTVKLWDVQSGRELRTFRGHTRNVTSVAFSPDGRLAISGSADNTVKLWDVQSGRERHTFTGHSDVVTSVAFSPDGRLALSGSWDKTLRLWCLASESGRPKFTADFSAIRGVVVSPDGRLVLSASGDRGFRLWDVASGRAWSSISDAAPSWVFSVAFSPDGRLALSGASDKTVRLWEVATGRELRRLNGHTNAVVSVAFSPDGRLALSGGYDRTVRLWEVATGRELHTFTGHTNGVMSVAFSPDGRLALSGSWDNTLRLWEVATGQELRTFTGHTKAVSSVAFSPDGRQALSGSYDDTVRLWDVATGHELRILGAGQGSVTSVAFSPDGRLALSGSANSTVRLWEVGTGRGLHTFTGHRDVVSSVTFSPDGRLALSGSYDCTVRLWDVETGRELRTLPSSGYQPWVMSVAFSPDGRLVLSGVALEGLQLCDISLATTYRTFEEKLGHARKALQDNPDNPNALATLGDWYAFRGLWDWGAEFLERARKNGAPISSLTLARCYWQTNELDSARRELQRAVDNKEAPESYLQLCVSALHQVTNAIPSTLQQIAGTSIPDTISTASGEAPVLTHGYYLLNDEVIFDFYRSDYESTRADDGTSLPLSKISIEKVCVAGDFNDWTRDQWVMQKTVGLGHYELRRKLSEFAGKSVFQFKFIINDTYWVDLPMKVVNRAWDGAGYENLRLDLPPEHRQPISSGSPVAVGNPILTATSTASAEATTLVCGYHVLNDEVVFDFNPTAYKSTTADTGGTRVPMREIPIEKVCVAGEFNGWAKDQWVMQKTNGLGHYVLRRKLSEFAGKSVFQFKFIINGKYWADPPTNAANCAFDTTGIPNLRLYLQQSVAQPQPPSGAPVSAGQSLGESAPHGKNICGYRIDNDDVVFEFDPQIFSIPVDHDAEVLITGEFNHWLDNDKGTITNGYPQWLMHRIDENHYTLRKKVAEFQSKSQWQFKFVVNRQTWSVPPPNAVNRAVLDGNANLTMTIPPLTTKTSPAQN